MVLLFSLLVVFNVQADELDDNVRMMALDLEQKYPGTIKIKIAILQFRTNSNELTRFNQYLQDQFYANYKNSDRFEVIDQVTVNRIIESLNWNLENSTSFEIYNELSLQIYRNLNIIPDAFIYGLIEDHTETISITSYILPNGIKGNIYSIAKINSNELTNKLLGKVITVESENIQQLDNQPYYYLNCLHKRSFAYLFFKKEDNYLIPV